MPNTESVDARRRRTRIDTLCAKADHYLDLQYGAVVPPIQPATTFARDDNYELFNPAHGYGRDQNPSVIPAEGLIAALEDADESLLFASGMAAIAAVFRTSAPHATLLVPDSLYHGTRTWLQRFAAESDRKLVQYRGGDFDDLRQHAADALPKLIWIETPSNPLLQLIDIEAAVSVAREIDAVVAVDSTVATPVHSNPLNQGADVVVHSATKALNGHSDLLAGAVVFAPTARDFVKTDVFARIRAERAESGAVLGAFEAWLLLRGLRTLALRVRAASANAMEIANFLDQHSAVEAVHYPGLTNHPQHATAAKQMYDGFGSLLSFQVRGDPGTARGVATALKSIISATSLGGTETLIEHRASVEPPGSPVPENLLRLSVGIEGADDMIEDLEQALAASRR